jgi:hypothetical protein
MTRLQLVIFSKDRPAQLELLLRSVKRFWQGWERQRIQVLFAHSTEAFSRGFGVVRELHPEFGYVDEATSQRPFKDNVVALLGDEPYIAFLVDDNVVKEPFSLAEPEFERLAADPDVAALSLRLAPHMDYCYPADLHTPPPPFDEDRVWRWVDAGGDWGYPMSLDGNVFRSAELRPLIERADFTDPNSLEVELARGPLAVPKMICRANAAVLNIPANRVQTTVLNRHSGGDAARLNRMFLAGARLDLEPLVGLKTPAPHHPVALRWQGRRWRLQGTEAPSQRLRRMAARVIGSFRAGWRSPSASSKRR